MQVILLERIARLGQMGDTVRVKDGYARNYLLPKGKALRANKGNLERFEAERSQLEARNLERKQEAEKVDQKLSGRSFTAIRQAGDSGQLYGSVSTRDIAEILTASGFTAARSQVELNKPIKELGVHQVAISLHPEVISSVDIIVARSEEEAERIARGEDVTARADEEDLEEEVVDVEEIFEEIDEDTLETLREGPEEELEEEVSQEAASSTESAETSDSADEDEDK